MTRVKAPMYRDDRRAAVPRFRQVTTPPPSVNAWVTRAAEIALEPVAEAAQYQVLERRG